MPIIRETEKGKRRNLAAAVPLTGLVRFFKRMQLPISPSQVDLKRHAEAEFRSRVTGNLIKKAQEKVWGKQGPGPRGNRRKVKVE
jgi:hypothetical protein